MVLTKRLCAALLGAILGVGSIVSLPGALTAANSHEVLVKMAAMINLAGFLKPVLSPLALPSARHLKLLHSDILWHELCTYTLYFHIVCEDKLCSFTNQFYMNC